MRTLGRPVSEMITGASLFRVFSSEFLSLSTRVFSGSCALYDRGFEIWGAGESLFRMGGFRVWVEALFVLIGEEGLGLMVFRVGGSAGSSTDSDSVAAGVMGAGTVTLDFRVFGTVTDPFLEKE
ncbi:hypothetical protein F2Q68_00027693 [Brassica cretica]|uniref:Uncharacterized protein n=1 Tax=Brassica cretica TaxID=69181 RepID=A0A3N6TW80_BRACR|nr:hypothetical protein F2Q68_00027693 [Brassica cretica]